MRNDSAFGVLRFQPSRGLPALVLLRQTRLFVVRTAVLLTREGEQVCETGVTESLKAHWESAWSEMTTDARKGAFKSRGKVGLGPCQRSGLKTLQNTQVTCEESRVRPPRRWPCWEALSVTTTGG